MSHISVVFPGQGAQKPGMGKDFFDNFDIAKKMFEKANKVSQYNRDYKELCFNGSAEELQMTVNTQPCIYIVNCIIYEILKEKGLSVNFAAGHSLGEYSALYAAQVFDFETGLKLIEKRADFMNSCAEKFPGTMAAIIGLENEQVEKICSDISDTVSPAGYNSPGQVVISGKQNAVEKAIEKANELNAKKTVILKVSGAWHSELMKEAQENLKNELDKYTFNTPAINVVSNFTAQPENKSSVIKNALIEQLCAPVKWVQSVNSMIENNVTDFIEAGPNKILTGLIKRISGDVKISTVMNLKTLDKFLEN